MRTIARIAGAAVVVLIIQLAEAGGASAASSLCPFGSDAGECVEPRGVAVDRSNGRIYVADRGNNRINAFGPDGKFLLAFGWGVADGATNTLQTCTAICFQGIPGSGPGQLSGPIGIAVDNEPGSSALHDVYVVNGQRVQRFSPEGEFILMLGGDVNKTQVEEGGSPAERNVCTAVSGDICGGGVGGSEGARINSGEAIAVGPGGIVHVGDSRHLGSDQFERRVDRFEPTGKFIESLDVSVLATGFIAAIAVASTGDFYVLAAGEAGAPMRKYNPSGAQTAQFGVGANTRSLAIDSTDRPIAGQIDAGFRVITRYDTSGTPISRFGYGEIDFNLVGLAADAAGRVLGSEEYVGSPSPGNRVVAVTAPPPGPLVVPGSVEAISVGNTKATLRAEVNPESKPTTYHFEYVDQHSFDEDGFSSPAVRSTPESPVGSDLTLHSVEAVIGCPDPVNEASGGNCLNPETVYRFRVIASNVDGPDQEAASFITRPPLLFGDLWSTEVGVDHARLHAEVNPLGIPATSFFQYVDDTHFKESGFTEATEIPNVDGGQAPIALGAAEVEQIVSVQLSSLAPGTLYHYRVLAANPFLTTPLAQTERTFMTLPLPAKSPPCPNDTFRIGPAASLPDCRAYEMVSPVEKNGGDVVPLANLLKFPAGLQQSSADGGRFAYSSATAFPGAASAPFTSQYVATRRDGESWSTEPISPIRGSTSIISSANARLDGEFKAFSDPVLSSGWLLHDTDPILDSCAEAGYLNLYRRDVSGDFEALTTNKPSNQSPTQYWPELQGVSVDGSHAVFRANGKLLSKAANITGYQLYEHVRSKGCGELRLVSVLPGGTASAQESSAGTHNVTGGESRENTVARAISSDGSRIFWTAAGSGPGALYVRIDGEETVEISAAPAQFWTAAVDGGRAVYTVGERLFEFDVEKRSTVSIADGVVGVVEASRDVSRIYFVSTDELAGAAEGGAPNLYLRQPDGTVRFVVTLAAADVTAAFRRSGFSVVSPRPVQRGARVTADGRTLVFVSNASLTGYDNLDAVTAEPNLEIFLYEAEDDRLVCLSCNPSSARPKGVEFEGTNGATRQVAAQLPVWESQLYAPRVLSEDGSRIFFESFEKLVARDRNGAQDVYEWQRAATEQACRTRGADSYVQAAGGCLSLISSGDGPTGAEFMDASAGGADVFIRTAASLLPQDPGLIDVYDARVEGGLPTPPPSEPFCEGEACQNPPVSPEDPAPASSAFAGEERLPGRRARRCPKGKRPVKRKGKRRCVAKRNPRRTGGQKGRTR